MPAFECRHVVGFGETSLVGNAYFSHCLAWQGTCRERFLFEHAPEVAGLLSNQEVAFFTARCSCDYLAPWGFGPLDPVLIRMRLERFRGGRMSLAFEYVDERSPERLVARGTQEVHCKSRRGGEWVPTPFPTAMIRALLDFADSEELRLALLEALEFQLPRPAGPLTDGLEDGSRIDVGSVQMG